jgi:ribose transport system substrate-binding protein
VKDSKKVGQVKIVCFDEEEETLQAGPGRGHFCHGGAAVLSVWLPSVHLDEQVPQRDKSVVPADKKVIVPTLAVTKDKVDEFCRQPQ